ncbi:MAG: YbaB/EbfC family nucleoid-associated protein [Candidatus Magasanikbacteria bacterium]
MFNKLKQFKDLRDQAKEMQSKLAEEKVTSSSNGVELTMNGNLEIINVNISPELLSTDKKAKLETAFKDAHADALKKMQRIMAMKMKEMGGLPNIPGLS